MSREIPSEQECDAIERQTETEAALIRAQFADVPTDTEFDFCNGCPLLNGHEPSEVASADEQLSVSLRMGLTFTGSIISMALRFKDQTESKPMLLGVFHERVYTTRMAEVARAEAARETQQCPKPKSIPPFLGPIAIKRCQALRKYNG